MTNEEIKNNWFVKEYIPEIPKSEYDRNNRYALYCININSNSCKGEEMCIANGGGYGYTSEVNTIRAGYYLLKKGLLQKVIKKYEDDEFMAYCEYMDNREINLSIIKSCFDKCISLSN